VSISGGTSVGHYRILSRIGAGGMGEVYLAQDTKLGRKVALKILPEQYTRESDRLRRFGQEARAASALNHPNIITIFEIGQVESSHFIATEFIEGETLRERTNAADLAIPDALEIAIQVSAALAASHSAGIVHRDIKPENIMLRPDGYVKVLDFGLAKLTEKVFDEGFLDHESETRAMVMTDPNIVMGTPHYMSPEQARGLALDPRADIFSLGVVIYEMITGRTPFDGATPSDIIALILQKDAPPLARYSREVPAELERIVMKTLRKNREERYQTIKDLALDLKHLKQSLEFEALRSRSVDNEFDDGFEEDGGQRETILTGSGDVAAGVRRAPAVANSGSGNRRSSGAQRNRRSSGAQVTSVGIDPPQPTSSAEYIVSEIKKRKTGFAAAAVLAVIGVLAIFYVDWRGGAINTLAVLPLVNKDADPNLDYLPDGLTERLINSLSQFPSLKVMSHTSVLRYKSRESGGAPPDPRTVGRDLGVRGVLTGSVQKRGDQVTVYMELIDARDNSRIWGKEYNRPMSEILAVQEEIASEMPTQLRLSLNSEQKRRVEAFQLYLRGRYYWNKRTVSDLIKGVDLFEQAVAKDPNYAQAHGGLADSYMMLGVYGALTPTEAFPKAKAAAEKALSINDGLAEAHASLAFVKNRFEWDWAGAEDEYKRALELNPGYAPAHQWYSIFLVAMNRRIESINEAKKAQSLDPLSPIVNSNLGWVLFLGHQYEEAIKQCKKTLEANPNFFGVRRYLGLAYEQVGKYDEAIAEFQKARQLSGDIPVLVAALGHAYASAGKMDEARKILNELLEMAKQRRVSTYDFAVLYTALGDKEKAFEWLQRAYEEHNEYTSLLGVEPRLDPLRSDPRYTELLQKIGLAK
jgi:serine/threonine protein kinase/Tfp pilus assembly protein PilF